MRIALVGGVQSTAVALDSLLKHGAHVVGVLGYVPRRAQHVSGYVDVVEHARRAGVAEAVPFTRVNDQATVEVLDAWAPDVLLVVGLSQIVSKAVRDTARELAVGFHPTKLPRGRGRAPIAWLVLKHEQGAATLFELTAGADEGDILAQVDYEVRPDDHASDVLNRCMDALHEAIGRFVHDVEEGALTRTPQSDADATYWGARTPEAGRIDWTLPASAVDALVRATAAPHPGAYTITAAGERIVFMRSAGPRLNYTGVPGRLLDIRGGDWLIACGHGAVLLGDVRRERQHLPRPRIGEALGYGIADLDRLLMRAH